MTDPVEVRLDDNVLAGIAELICGDDSTPHYRRGFEIEKFFQAAGWHVRELEGGRRNWVLERLDEYRDDSDALRRMLLRLADPREYLEDDEVRGHVVVRLNQLLAVEGYQIDYQRGRPALVEHDPVLRRPVGKAPLELTANLSKIVSDVEFGKQLRHRLDEASACWAAGAHIAAIIMLGSMLEGVLYDFARARLSKEPNDKLETLIDGAYEQGWIERDAKDYSQTLRGYRNLVHPKRQLVDNHSPDEDTVRICWNVAVSALNDLAKSV